MTLIDVDIGGGSFMSPKFTLFSPNLKLCDAFIQGNTTFNFSFGGSVHHSHQQKDMVQQLERPQQDNLICFAALLNYVFRSDPKGNPLLRQQEESESEMRLVIEQIKRAMPTILAGEYVNIMMGYVRVHLHEFLEAMKTEVKVDPTRGQFDDFVTADQKKFREACLKLEEITDLKDNQDDNARNKRFFMSDDSFVSHSLLLVWYLGGIITLQKIRIKHVVEQDIEKYTVGIQHESEKQSAVLSATEQYIEQVVTALLRKFIVYSVPKVQNANMWNIDQDTDFFEVTDEENIRILLACCVLASYHDHYMQDAKRYLTLYLTQEFSTIKTKFPGLSNSELREMSILKSKILKSMPQNCRNIIDALNDIYRRHKDTERIDPFAEYIKLYVNIKNNAKRYCYVDVDRYGSPTILGLRTKDKRAGFMKQVQIQDIVAIIRNRVMEEVDDYRVCKTKKNKNEPMVLSMEKKDPLQQYDKCMDKALGISNPDLNVTSESISQFYKNQILMVKSGVESMTDKDGKSLKRSNSFANLKLTPLGPKSTSV